jgi:hypothetical protein
VLRLNKQRLIAAAIILFWLITMGVLFEREVLRPAWQKAAPGSARLDKPYDMWLGVFVDEHRVGFINMKSTPDTRGEIAGATLAFTAKMGMTLLGKETNILLSGNAYVTEEKGLQEFDLRVRSGESDMRIGGAITDGTLNATLQTAGEEIPFKFPIGDNVSLGGGAGMPAMSLPTLEPGSEIYIDTFDPLSMQVRKTKLTCIGTETLEVGGEPVETYIIETEMSGTTTTAWVTADEEVIKAETPWGFNLRKVTPEEALQPVEMNEQASLIRMMAVHPTGVAVYRDATKMVFRIGGVEPSVWPPSEPPQVREGEVYTITPVLAAPVDLADVERVAALESDPFVQADHEQIQQASREILGGEQDPETQARLLYEWVFESLEKEAVVSVPSALDVLRTRVGDCNEHTVLYTALARAAGLPTRIAIGIVWSDAMDGFYYHAWPEVYIGGRWLWIDPTLGQPIADATHIKLFNGSINQWTKLLPFLGQIQIEVLEVE